MATSDQSFIGWKLLYEMEKKNSERLELQLKSDVKKKDSLLMEVGLCLRNGYAKTDIGKSYLVNKIESVLKGEQ